MTGQVISEQARVLPARTAMLSDAEWMNQSTSARSIEYRPDIDGLRAIAVLAVVAFHAYPQGVRGGFIGVDVFFVISGFLISTIILRKTEDGSFGFAEFYGRRVRRLFPALIAVLGACLLFAWFATVADEYKNLGKHVAAGAAFVSNFAYWSETGYFDSDAYTKPLLHLWSLGIEEQFYIVWPLLLWAAFKARSSRLPLMIGIAAASFAANVYLVNTDPGQAYYSPHARMWELAMGSILAYVTLHRPAASAAAFLPGETARGVLGLALMWDPLESTCRHASLSIL